LLPGRTISGNPKKEAIFVARSSLGRNIMKTTYGTEKDDEN
jgi:hypothetical protein